MEQFFSLFAKSRLATLLVIVILCYTGIRLILAATTFQSLPGISGAAILCVVAVLSIIAFVDYRYKEHTDNAFGHLNKTISTLSRTIKTTSETATAREKVTQETLKGDKKTVIGGGRADKRTYTILGDEETSTE